MISLDAFQVVCALKGGFRMSSLSSSVDHQVVPTQVWASLSIDLQAHVIGLLAHLALNVVVARHEHEHAGKEPDHAHRSECPQNPS